jgi:hypothetical protein
MGEIFFRWAGILMLMFRIPQYYVDGLVMLCQLQNIECDQILCYNWEEWRRNRCGPF